MTSFISPSESARAGLGLALGFVLGCCVLVVGNWVVDRWSVYRSDSVRFLERGPSNFYYLKSRYLLEEADTRSCLIMGSSRVAAIDGSSLGDDCYNFHHPLGSVVKNLALLERLVAAGKAPKVVYLGLDDASYGLGDKDSPRSRGIPSGVQDWLEFHSEYLLRYPQWKDLDILRGFMPRVNKPWGVLDPGLELSQLRTVEQGYFADRENHEADFSDLRATIWEAEDLVAPTLALLQRFRTLTESRGIELVVFINPMNYKTYLKIDHERFSRFRRELAEIVPFLDFSGLYEHTLDNRYWAETSHYTPGVGDLMASCLSSRQSKAGSCRRIDAQDVDAFLLEQQRADSYQLLHSARFAGATFIPGLLAEYLELIAGHKAGADSLELTDQVQLRDFSRVSLPYLHNDSLDPKIRIMGTCFDPGAVYLVQLEVSYPVARVAYLYSPGPKGRYHRTRRDRLDLAPGRHVIQMLVRDLGCDGYLRFDPMQKRGDLFLHSIRLRELGAGELLDGS